MSVLSCANRHLTMPGFYQINAPPPFSLAFLPRRYYNYCRPRSHTEKVADARRNFENFNETSYRVLTLHFRRSLPYNFAAVPTIPRDERGCSNFLLACIERSAPENFSYAVNFIESSKEFIYFSYITRNLFSYYLTGP